MLPNWPAGTAGVLCVAGPRAIPVSTAVRAGERRLLFALARRRETLARLRDDAVCALYLSAPGLACTVEGRATVIVEELESAPSVAALELVAERVHDHLADGRTEIVDGIRWQWREAEDDRRDRALRDELARLAAAG